MNQTGDQYFIVNQYDDRTLTLYNTWANDYRHPSFTREDAEARLKEYLTKYPDDTSLVGITVIKHEEVA